jgi:biopolymer transport protein ExbD
MDFSGQIGGVRHRPRQEINLVPFIDILLVLLVIFIVASPVLTHAVKIDLPRATSRAEKPQVQDVSLFVLRDGDLVWNGESVEPPELERRLREEAAKDPQPGLRIQADAKTPYESLAQAMAASARAGIGKISFVSLPDKN